MSEVATDCRDSIVSWKFLVALQGKPVVVVAVETSRDTKRF